MRRSIILRVALPTLLIAAPSLAVPTHIMKISYVPDDGGQCILESSLDVQPDPERVWKDNGHQSWFDGGTSGAPKFLWELNVDEVLAHYEWALERKGDDRPFFDDKELTIDKAYLASNDSMPVEDGEEWNYHVIATWTGAEGECPPTATLDPQVKFKTGAGLIGDDVAKRNWLLALLALAALIGLWLWRSKQQSST